MKKTSILFLIIVLALSSSAQTKKELREKINALEVQQKVLDLKYAEMLMRTDNVQKENIKLSAQIDLLTKIISDNQRANSGAPSNPVQQNSKYTPRNYQQERAPQEKSRASKPQKSQPESSTRCAATTKKGSRCLRNAAPGSNTCWQH